MGQVQFTEKHLKVCASTSGTSRELYYSKIFHQQNLPILISPLILRSRLLGQIDVCFIDQFGEVSVVEVKSSGQGLHLSFGQRMRLNRALDFVAAVLGRGVRLKVMS